MLALCDHDPTKAPIMNLLDCLLTDVRFALRLLRRSPAFGATLIGVLVVGIGATTAMFSIVVSLLLRPLPYPHPEELTMVWATQPLVNPSPASVPDFQDWRAEGTTFASMAATEYMWFSLSSEASDGGRIMPEAISGANVSGEFFQTLGIGALHGRLLGPDDDRIGAPRVAVIGADLWHRRFASDPHVVGRTIALSGEPYTIIGIAPEGFRYSGPNSDRAEVWTSFTVGHKGLTDEASTDRGSHFIHVVGRRRPGISIEQAQAQLAGVAKSIAEKYPESNTNVGVRLVDLHDQLVSDSRETVWVLFIAIGLVFLIVCANVANLLLARAASRRAEMAARAALGATRGRLVAQVLTETAVVFVTAAIGGSVLAHGLVDTLASGILRGGGRGAGAFTIDIRVDAYALGFAILTSLVCGIVFGLVPALEASRVSPHAVLKESAARTSITRSQRLVRGGLVIAQVALAFALLVGAGLSLRAFDKVASTPPGFDVDDLATARIELPAAKYDDARAAVFVRDLIERVAAQPGVVAATANSTLPMCGSQMSSPFTIEGRPPWSSGARPHMDRNMVTPGYFRAMGIPLLRGRDFTAADTAGTRPVMILSQAAAERYFPGEDPLGHRIDLGDKGKEADWREIVGIVGDVRRRGLGRTISTENFVPHAQAPFGGMILAIRTPRPEALLNELPGIVASLDPEQAVSAARLMRARVNASVGPQRFVASLLGAFAAAALILATLGLFGLVSYTTGQRTREIGIRVALGASPSGVVGVVMRDGLRLLAVGLVAGVVGAVFVGRALAGRVSGAAAFDPVVVASIFVILGLAGTLASLLPALRAVRIPPAAALRYE